jgi:REP element-mobilizing transposase RayT
MRSVVRVPRKPRSSLPDGFFHVTNRGNRRADIVLDALEIDALLHRIEDATARVEWRWLAYCVMPNHFHLLVEARVPQLSKGMQLLSAAFAQWSNREHRRTGHLFQGRFKTVPIARGPHLFETLRYVALNPVSAGLCRHPLNWPWSSYGAITGRRPARDGFATADVHALFAADRTRAIDRIEAYVEDGLRSLRDAPAEFTVPRGHGLAGQARSRNA